MCGWDMGAPGSCPTFCEVSLIAHWDLYCPATTYAEGVFYATQAGVVGGSPEANASGTGLTKGIVVETTLCEQDRNGGAKPTVGYVRLYYQCDIFLFII